mgnify:CR=1 FL=1
MLRLLAGLGLVATTLLLSGCYLGPSYSYVRQPGYQDGAYYGQSQVYDGGYYLGSGYSSYSGAGYGYGCCYAPGVSVGVGAVWYDRPRYRGYAPSRYRSYAPSRYRGYAPPRYRGQIDRRPRDGGGWRSGPGRTGRGAAGFDRSGPPRGAVGPRHDGGRPAARRHRSGNP